MALVKLAKGLLSLTLLLNHPTCFVLFHQWHKTNQSVPSISFMS